MVCCWHPLKPRHPKTDGCRHEHRGQSQSRSSRNPANPTLSSARPPPRHPAVRPAVRGGGEPFLKSAQGRSESPGKNGESRLLSDEWCGDGNARRHNSSHSGTIHLAVSSSALSLSPRFSSTSLRRWDSPSISISVSRKPISSSPARRTTTALPSITNPE